MNYNFDEIIDRNGTDSVNGMPYKDVGDVMI